MKQVAYIFGIIAMMSCGDDPRSRDRAETLEETAKRIHDSVLAVDTHIDINVSQFTDSVNYTQNLTGQVDLPRMRSGGLDVSWLVVYTGQDSLTPAGYAKAQENAMAKFEAIHRLCDSIAPNEISLAVTAKAAREIHAQGRKVAMIGVENAYPMGTDLGNFKKYYDLGARYISLSHNGHSQFCDSHTGETDGVWAHNGLSNLGREAVKEMNRLGIMADVSHLSKASMEEIAGLSKAPIIASHSSARALCDHSRNLDDDQLRLLAKTGGVVQAVAFPEYLNADKSKAYNTFIEEIRKHVADSLGTFWFAREERAQASEAQRVSFEKNADSVRAIADRLARKRRDAPPQVAVTDLVDHIDYLMKTIGIDHVGISSDFDGGGGIAGWSNAGETFNVTLELVRRGYSGSEIAKLWGGNLLRVLTEVQDLADTE